MYIFVFSFWCTVSSDCWAVGCLIYFLIAGKSPFDDSNTMRMNMKIRQVYYYGHTIFLCDTCRMVLLDAVIFNAEHDCDNGISRAVSNLMLTCRVLLTMM